MNEINFFEENKKKFKLNFSNFDTIDERYKKYILPLLIIVILLIFIIMNLTVTNKIKKLNSDISDLNFELDAINNTNLSTDDITSSSEEVIEQKRKSIEIIKGIEDYSNVSSDLLEEIKLAMPSNVFLNDMQINDGTITITGYAQSSNTVAKFQNNLEKSDLITNVFVSEINNDLGNFNFILTANVRS